MDLDAEHHAQYVELDNYFKRFKARDFLKIDDKRYGLQGAEKHFEDLILWIKRFFNKRNKYREQAPIALLNNTINSINDTRRTIESIQSARDTDPTSFLNNKKSFIEDLERRYGEIYTHLIVPMSGYFGIDKGGIGEIRKSAEEELEKVQETGEKVQKSGEEILVVEDAKREAASENAASVTAEHYDSLATKFENYRWWAAGFFIYISIWVIGFILLWSLVPDFKHSISNFDPSVAPAYVLKIVLLAAFVFGLNFISKNYNARLQVHITAHTRATRIKTWRAFVEAPELKEENNAKARIAEGVAKIMFSDIPTGLDRSNYRFLNELFSRRDKQDQ